MPGATEASAADTSARKPVVRPPTPPPEVVTEIFATALFTSADDPAAPASAAAASYAVVIDDQLHRVRLSQPLATPHQAYRTGALRSLLSALQLITCLQLRSVHIFLSDDNLVSIVMDARPLGNETADSSLRRRLSAPTTFASSQDSILWTSILSLIDANIEQGASIRLSHEQDSPSMHIAADLSRTALERHQYCEHCHRNYGPKGTKHKCGSAPTAPPIPDASSSSLTPRVAAPTCPECSKPFHDLAELQHHVETACPEVLERWFSHTKIVKS